MGDCGQKGPLIVHWGLEGFGIREDMEKEQFGIIKEGKMVGEKIQEYDGGVVEKGY